MADILPWPQPGSPQRPLRRVLMTADTVGGVWTYAMELSHRLAAAGIEVVLATMGRPLAAAQRAEAAEVPLLIVEESAYKLEWMENAAEDVARAGAWLQELEERHHPDLVHLNEFAYGALPWSAPVVMVAHSCVCTWWSAVRGDALPDSFASYVRSLRAGLAGASCLVAPSASFLRAFRAAHGDLPPAVVVSNGRDPRRYAPARKENVFLSVGRLWDEAKNVRALARIAPELPWPVRLAGEATSPDGREVVLPNVELLGPCAAPVVADLMARAAVYVLPARYEPFGLSVLEAALCGCALVLGDIPTLREVWGGAALYAAPDDDRDLRQVLRWLAANPERRAEHAARARARAQELTATAMGDRYLALYRQVLAGGRVPRTSTATVSA